MNVSILLVVLGSCLIHGAPEIFPSRTSNADDKALSQSTLSFAVNLISNLHHHAGTDENLLISPINIYAVMAMAHLGTAGSTRTDLANALGLPTDENQATEKHEALGKLLKLLQTKEKFASTELSMANGLFVQAGRTLLPSYLGQVKKYYESEIKNVDFNSGGTTNEINKWASDSTKGRIPELYTSPIDPMTRILLVGALYFNGRWKEHFPTYKTKQEKFNTGVKDIDVQLMNNAKNVPYYDDPQLQFEAIQLPYDGYEYTMAIILPYKTQTLMNMTHYLKVENVQKVFGESKTIGIDYKIPRMKFSWKNSLKEVLSMQGLKTLFEKSDLSNMVSEKDLKVSDVMHAAEIEVDEEGTVASAITSLQMSTYSLPIPPENPKPFYVNRPFMVVIYHQETATPIFMAMVHQPNGSS